MINRVNPNKKFIYLLSPLPIPAFGVGLLVGWLAYLNELTAWTISMFLLLLIPLLCIIACVLLIISPFFIKSYGGYLLIASLSIAGLVIGIEITSKLASKSFELWLMVLVGIKNTI